MKGEWVLPPQSPMTKNEWGAVPAAEPTIARPARRVERGAMMIFAKVWSAQAA